MLCTFKFILWFALLSLGILRSKKTVMKDELLKRDEFRNISLPFKSKEKFDSKNCELIKVLIRKTEKSNEKTNLRRLTVLNQRSNKIAILDLNPNDHIIHTESCLSSNKYWSVCLKSHLKQINLNFTEQIDKMINNATEQSQKSVKLKEEILKNRRIPKAHRKLTKRSNLKYFKANTSELINENLIKSAKLVESQFFLVNCDFKGLDSSNCKMIKLIKKGCP